MDKIRNSLFQKTIKEDGQNRKPKKNSVLLKLLLVFVALMFCLSACGALDGDGMERTDVTLTEGAKEDTPAADNGEKKGETPDSNPTEANTPAADPTEAQLPEGHVGFKVEGSKLLDAKGNEFVMRGVNHAHAWYKAQDGTALSAIAETGANTVRIVCADGEQWTKDSVAVLNMLIETCKNKKLVCILEVHDATGSDNVLDLLAAVAYWTEVKEALIGNEDYVILNIANEWIGGWNEDLWCETYSEAVSDLRSEGIKNLIMVDAPGWGQYGDAILNKGQKVLDADPEKNTMFSVHMYGTAGGSQSKIKKVLQGAIDRNLCICVGEFGYNHSDGDVDEGYIMEFCCEHDLGYLGWSWKGNGGGVEYLDLSNDWEGKNLSPDWGEVLINGKNGIKETSEICSVYDDAA